MYEPMPRRTNTPTIASGRYSVASVPTVPNSFSIGCTIRSIITSVDATTSMPTVHRPKIAR